MKLRSHGQLLCKFKRQFARQVHVQLEAHDGSSCVRAVQGTTWRSRGQGELHRRVYRAQRRAQEDRESCPDRCTGHKEGRTEPKLALRTPSWSPNRLGRAASADCTGKNGVQEASLEGHVESKFCSEASLEREMESKLRSEGSLDGQVESKLRLETSLEGQVRPMRRPRATKFGPRGVQQAGSSAQEAPSWAQKAYKTHSKSTSKTFAARQGRTSKSDDSTALLVVFRGSQWPWRPVGTAKWSPSCAWRHLESAWRVLGGRLEATWRALEHSS